MEYKEFSLFNSDLITVEEITEFSNRFIPICTYKEAYDFLLNKSGVILNKGTDDDLSSLDESKIPLLISLTYKKIDSHDVFVNRLTYTKLENQYPDAFKSLNTKGPEEAGKLTADYLLKTINNKSPITIELINSGFAITINSFEDTDAILLQKQFHEYEAVIGRDTMGLIYSNQSIIYTEIFIDYIISKIIATTLDPKAYKNKSDIKKFILVTDLDSIILGVYKNINKKGKELYINCKNMFHEDKDKVCDNIVQIHVEPENMLYADFSNFTEEMNEQRKRTDHGSVTAKEVSDYQQNILNFNENTYEVGDLIFEFTIPDFNRKIKSGTKWVNNIITNTSKAFLEDMTPDAKNSLIMSNTNAVILCNYAEFIKSVSLKDINEIITDPKEISKILANLSQNVIISKGFIDAYKDFISKSSVTFIGIPKYTCTKCKAVQTTEELPELRVIDMMSVFLELMTVISEEIWKRGENLH